MQQASSGRRVPAIPVAEERIPLIIDTDTAHEVDDQYALALPLCRPDRLEVRGIVAAHYGDRGGPEGIARSLEEIDRMLAAAGRRGEHPVAPGSHPLVYSQLLSPGVDLILAEARRASPERPLWLVALGPATDIVSAYLADPSIADRVVVLYHGRKIWPEKCWNFNVYHDVRAARALCRSTLPLVFFDTGTYLRLPIAEAEDLLGPHGALGRYLVDIRRRHPRWMDANKGFFDLGDLALLVDPTAAEWEEVPVPSVGWDLRYDHTTPHGRMLRVYQVDRSRTFRLLADARAQAPHVRPS